jgi:hypothetical protein
LPHDFVFPSGRRCSTYDDLIQNCQEEWGTAGELLRRGVFTQFFTSIGRIDLARLAQGAQAQADTDQAVNTFLSGLPGTRPRGPRLELNPRRLVLGSLMAGETRLLRLTVINQGQGALQGNVTLEQETRQAGPWVRLLGGPDPNQCPINTAREQEVLLQVETRHLSTGQSYAAKLTVITNGGVVEVPVRMDLPAHPFPWAPFDGLGSQREMAERMRRQPRAAVTMLESGEIARWFLANGWVYPVQGPTAPGLAAVQQFFEALGLARAPVVQVSETDVRMSPVHPEVVRWQVSLFTAAKKWVYAQVESDSLWLKILTPQVSGPRRADVAFEVDSSLLEPNRVYAGQVHVLANAGQALTVHVRVDVQKGHRSLARRLFRPFLSGALAGVVTRLLLAPLAAPGWAVRVMPGLGAGGTGWAKGPGILAI